MLTKFGELCPTTANMLALFNFLNDNKPLLVPVIDKEAFLKLFNFLQETTLNFVSNKCEIIRG